MVLTVLATVSHFKMGSFQSLWRNQPTLAVGDLLYPHFEAQNVHTIKLGSSKKSLLITRNNKGWTNQQGERIDARHIGLILNHTQSLVNLEPVTPEQFPQSIATKQETFTITMEDSNGKVLVSYELGPESTWYHKDEQENLFPTCFIRRLDTETKNFFLCPGSTRLLFKDNLTRLIDHRPFYFHPNQIKQIELSHQGSRIFVERNSPHESWEITKPLLVPADQQSVVTLLSLLYQLEALKVSSNPQTSQGIATEITLHSFGQDQAPVTLSIYTPDTPESQTCWATTSDQSFAFELPRLHQKKAVLPQLPLTLEKLRRHTVTNLNISAIKNIEIDSPFRRSALTLAIVQTASGPRWWQGIGQANSNANENTVAALFQALTRDQLLSYQPLSKITGLKPVKTLKIRSKDDTSLIIKAYSTPEAQYYLHREDQEEVILISGETFSKIAIFDHQWRDLLMWDFSITSLSHLLIQGTNVPRLDLRYTFDTEKWGARFHDRDVSSLLNEHRANKLLKLLQEIEVTQWLPFNHAGAYEALQEPTFEITALFRPDDFDSDHASPISLTLMLAPISQGKDPKFYFGKISGDSNFFILNHSQVSRLKLSLLDQ